MIRLACLTALALAAAAPPALAQSASGPLTVAVDCQGYVPGCDLDFFQTEVGFARFVRDQADGEVYVLVVRENTGGGGDRYTLFFEGRDRLAGRRDTLTTSAPPGASDDDQRRALLGRLQLGLVGFAAGTPLADRLSISYDAPTAEEAAEAEAAAVDPWNSWVFEIDGRGFFDGQSQQRFFNVRGSVSAQRVTEDLKVSVRPRASYNRDEYEYVADGEAVRVVSDNANYGLNAAGVVSLSAHWSAGARVDLSRNTFSNYDARLRVTPAVEYNLFPYAESTRRQLRFFYEAGVEAAAYQDTTIFLQTEEVLPVHEAGVAAEFAQPWGSVDVYTGASQYLSKSDKYNLSIGGGVDLRVFRGFNFRIDGRYAFVRDQINLRADNATSEEVLTNQQELATGYTYYASVGVSYSFGSIFNQVVNARFGG